MGKLEELTISMAISFQSYVTNYQRVLATPIEWGRP